MNTLGDHFLLCGGKFNLSLLGLSFLLQRGYWKYHRCFTHSKSPGDSLVASFLLFLLPLLSQLHHSALPRTLSSSSWGSVQFSGSVVSDFLQPHESQHTRPLCLSPTSWVHSNSRPWSRWCHPAISSSVLPFSCPQSLPASESFPMSQLFTWGGQSTGVSALTSILPVNSQDWSPLEWTGWISLQSKGLSRVFSNTTVQKHQFFGAQLSSQSNSHIHTWLLEKP